MKMCAQTKAGRKQPAISRFALASTKRKTERLRRRLAGNKSPSTVTGNEKRRTLTEVTELRAIQLSIEMSIKSQKGDY